MPDLKSLIRTIPDYPKPGILFRDVTTLMGDANGFRTAIEQMAEPYRNAGVQGVAGIEARGFILGGAIADKLSAAASCRSDKGELPGRTIAGQEYTLEYGVDIDRDAQDAIDKGEAHPDRRRPDRHRRHRGGRGQAGAPLGRRHRRRLLHHRSARSRRRQEARRARHQAPLPDGLRGTLSTMPLDAAQQRAILPRIAPWRSDPQRPVACPACNREGLAIIDRSARPYAE